MALLGVALAVSALVTACGGSALSPSYVRAANDAVQGQVAGGAADGGSSSTTSDPGAGGTGSAQSTSGDPAGSTRSSTSGGGASAGTGTASGTASGQPGPSGGTRTATAGTSATGGARASCAGFHNQTGITDKTITIANVADISGPVPGIFTSAQQAVKAYVAYFNATTSLCGRKLTLLPMDSRTDPTADQAAYLKACSNAFAAVGSMSAFDSGGAGTAQKCGLPDLRAAAVSDARNACTTCFGAQATDLHAFQNAVPDFFLAHYHASTQHAAMLYVNAAASVENARTQQAVEQKRGMRFVYSASFDVAEFNYTPYVQKMKQKGVRWVQFVGSQDEAVRLAQAMQNADFKPDVFLLDPTAYDPTFVKSGGSAVNGAFVFIDFTPLEEASTSKELRLYEAWLQQVAPGAAPSYFGIFAWSAARLFGAEAAGLGGRLTRAALVDRVRHVDGWTDHGMHAPQAVGPKVNSSCWRFLRLENGHWQPVGGRRYLCHGSTKLN
ncbi:ABC transporter substrate-binding protein [Nocardioides terrisoli]|uniref:ABC transporter substrate-binding protein n=1 Tax=Nocardioides terrisoli TaxID=3388267 RepID=UPI00287BB519|nr:ABC transporter substrate-binding protein [Nocardioides marmorisolisilvae]